MARVAKISLRYPVAPEHKLPLLLPLYALAPLAVEVYRRYWDRATWADYGVVGLKEAWPLVVVGLVIAVGGVVLLMASQVSLGWRRWSPGQTAEGTTAESPSWILLGALLPLTLFIGWVEELIFRGILVNGLLGVLPWVGMAIVASAIFALSHLIWDGPAGVPSLPGLGLMGLVLILARWVAGGSLSLAWGLHTGWIFAIALSDALHLTQPTDHAPRWLAGKPDQPLTGVAALGLMLLTGLGLGGFGLWSGWGL